MPQWHAGAPGHALPSFVMSFSANTAGVVQSPALQSRYTPFPTGPARCRVMNSLISAARGVCDNDEVTSSRRMQRINFSA